MSKLKQHTPGPWALDDRGYKFIVSAGDGYITRDVCRMDSSTMAAFAQEANARLIAAAPELLEALQLCLKALRHPTYHADRAVMDADDAACKAIAKATGGTI